MRSPVMQLGVLLLVRDEIDLRGRFFGVVVSANISSPIGTRSRNNGNRKTCALFAMA
jgi:hypothetical protein